MPAWIHHRADRLLAKNPSMPKGEAFGIATLQSHALGKSPKSYGTEAGRSKAQSIYKTPEDDKKTAAAGGFEHFENSESPLGTVKTALLERLVRLGATDVPGTPRLVMRERSPEELGQLQNKVTSAFGKLQAPLKKGVDHLTSALPGRLQHFARAAGHLAVDNPEIVPMSALPIPGLTPAYLAAKRGLEKTIDRFAPAKMAAAEPWEGFTEKYAETNVGQWWETVGGPHLAKGGDHGAFKKMMQDAQIPEGMQKKFMDVAAKKYPPGNTRRSPPPSGWGSYGGSGGVGGNDAHRAYSAEPPPGAGYRPTRGPQIPSGTWPVVGGYASMGAMLGAGLYAHKAEQREDPYTPTSAWKGRLGHYMAATPALAATGGLIGSLAARRGLLGAGVGAGLGMALGEATHRKSESGAAEDAEKAFRTGKDKKLLREASKTTAAHMKDQIGPVVRSQLTSVIPMIINGGSLRKSPEAMGALATGVGAGGALAITGGGLANKRRAGLAAEHLQSLRARAREAGEEKAAAGAPTRGGFMMASDVPPFASPRLDRAIQKRSDFATKEKDGDMLPGFATYGPGDFKRSKYAMSAHELAFEVLRLKEAGAAGQMGIATTPSAAATAAKTVGAPKMSAPGPSIAQIAKPRGPSFGTGIAGAFKTTIGGTLPSAMK